MREISGIYITVKNEVGYDSKSETELNAERFLAAIDELEKHSRRKRHNRHVRKRISRQLSIICSAIACRAYAKYMDDQIINMLKGLEQ